MKLDRFAFASLPAVLAVAFAFAFTSLAFASGCASSTVTRTASAAPLGAEAANVAATTNLMSAQLAGPAPKVGKSHLAIDDAADDIESGSTSSELDAPKEARRSDGSRRGGGFGSSK